MEVTDKPCLFNTAARRRYVLALSLVPGAGPVRLRRLLSIVDFRTLVHDIQGVIGRPGLAPGDLRFLQKVASLGPDALLAQADRQLHLCQHYRAFITTCFDSDYPANLQQSDVAPSVLFVRGTLMADKDSRSVAVVGTREATPQGRARAARLARHLVENDWTVVSGLARGIDTAAHRGALDAGGRTVAVVGCGLDRTYPRENSELADRIGENGAVITQFPFGASPLAPHFPMRNKTMALFSLATVVIEAGEQSGAKMQADFALSTPSPKRHVLFPRSLLDAQEEAGWAHLFLNRGAQVVEQLEDVPRIVLSHLKSDAVRQPPLPV